MRGLAILFKYLAGDRIVWERLMEVLRTICSGEPARLIPLTHEQVTLTDLLLLSVELFSASALAASDE